MAEKLYFSDEECRRVGFSPAMIFTLRKLAEFIDTQNRLAESEQAIVDANDAIDAANTDIGVLNTAVNSLDSRIDAYDALAPFVRQNQAAKPTYSAYAGQTVSVGYVQAEAQATDNAVKALGTAMASLLAALDTANVLS